MSECDCQNREESKQNENLGNQCSINFSTFMRQFKFNWVVFYLMEQLTMSS